MKELGVIKSKFYQFLCKSDLPFPVYYPYYQEDLILKSIFPIHWLKLLLKFFIYPNRKNKGLCSECAKELCTQVE